MTKIHQPLTLVRDIDLLQQHNTFTDCDSGLTVKTDIVPSLYKTPSISKTSATIYIYIYSALPCSNLGKVVEFFLEKVFTLLRVFARSATANESLSGGEKHIQANDACHKCLMLMACWVWIKHVGHGFTCACITHLGVSQGGTVHRCVSYGCVCNGIKAFHTALINL